MAQIKLGELLIKANVLHEGQLKAALAEQQKWGGKLGEILVRMEFVTEDTLVRALSKQLAIPAVNLDAVATVPPHVVQRIPEATARDYWVAPLQLRDEGKTLVVAMADPLNVQQLDDLRAVTKCRIVPGVAGRSAILRALARFYGTGEGELGVETTGSMRLVDAQGRPLNEAMAPPPAPPARAAPPPAPAARAAPAAPPVEPTPQELLRLLEDVQRKEVSALKAMVELLIEKGVFSRDEYLAKVKR